MKLTVIMPVYNERATFGEIFRHVQAVEIEKEIIIVDNCSTDGTRDLLRAISQPNVEVILQPQNYGKGTSVRTGIAKARGESIIIQDADLEYDPQDYHRLLREQERTGAVAVFGRRVPMDGLRQPLAFRVGGRALALVFSVLYGQWLTDIATCYKLIRADVLQALPLESSGFDLDFEIPARLALAGHRICEVPISYRPRPVKAGKKIRGRDGVVSLMGLSRWRFRR
ncbi:MAG: glycosyltransferase family 2 protein [Candidatus Rokubacteria bacterium]|nr:glycosyltransferase family 2 protein [Candidatus Rokubacteria bacterium]